MLTYNTLTSTAYDTQRFTALLGREGANQNSYLDPDGVPTIGLGFNLRIAGVQSVVLSELGFGVDSGGVALTGAALTADQGYAAQINTVVNQTHASDAALQTALDAVMAARDADVLLNGVVEQRLTFSFLAGTAVGSEMRTAFDTIADTVYEPIVDAWLAAVPDSTERVAFFTLGYIETGSNVLLTAGLATDVSAGDRLDAWYTIRYGSNASSDAGIHADRIADSNVFGLYDGGQGAGPADAVEAKAAYDFLVSNLAGTATYLNGLTGTGAPDDAGERQFIRDDFGAALTSLLADNGLTGQFAVADFLDTSSANGWFLTFGTEGTDYTGLGGALTGLTAGSLQDVLIGDATNETFIGGAEDDHIAGGAGTDTVDYGQDGGAGGVTVDLAAGTVTDTHGDTDTLANIESVIVTGLADTLLGASGAETLEGLGGDDVLAGRAGADILDGGAGTDTVDYGQDGGANGVTVDLAANTVVDTHGDTDTLVNVEQVLVTGNADTIFGTAGADTLNGLGGDDVLVGRAGDDALNGGAGSDTADYSQDGGAGAITADLTAGTVTDTHGDTDTLNSVEQVIGTGLADSLLGSSGADTLEGLGGDDVLLGRAGNDVLDGGAGTDTVDYGQEIGASGVTVDLAAGTVTDTHGGADTLIDVENVIVTGNADTIRGTAGADVLDGLAGDDVLTGRDGADTLDGGLGTDTADYSQDGGAGGVTVDLITNTATDTHGATDTLSSIETVIGSGQADSLSGSNAADNLQGGGGNDALLGLDGADVLNGGTGTDSIDYGLESGGGAVTVDLAGSTATDTYGATDTLTSIETVGGTALNDTLLGAGAAETLNGAGGNDVLAGRGGADALDGGAGTDTVDYGQDGGGAGVAVDLAAGTANDTHGATDTLTSIEVVLGSGQADSLLGSAIANTLTAGGGNDVVAGRAGNDLLDGGAGTDTLDYNQDGGVSGVTVNLGTGTATDSHGDTDTLTAFERVIGTNQVDTLLGGTGNETFIGRGGADVLNGGAGTDTVDYSQDGGAGAITVDLTAGTATDTHGATDTLTAIETVIGSGQADSLTGSAGADNLQGRGGNDALLGRGGNDVLNGGGGTDSIDYGLDGGAGAVTVDLGASSATDTHGATDTLTSIEQVTGTTLNDTILGAGAAETLNGAGGDDILAGRGGADVLDGGAGADTVDYSQDGGGAGVTVDLNAGTATDSHGATDTLTSIETVIGTTQADTLQGSANADTLQGDAGDDLLVGRAGADVLDGGAGFDTLDFALDGGAAAVTVNLATGTVTDTHGGTDTVSGIDQVLGTSLADTITGSAADEVFVGRDGADTIDGGAGHDIVDYTQDGGTGAVTVNLAAGTATDSYGNVDTLINIEQVTGSIDDDDILGSNANETLIGDAGDDTIDGAKGADILIGGDGDDYLSGDGDVTTASGTGGDTLDGGAGDDFMMGRYGNDTYRWGIGMGNDIVHEGFWASGTDTIELGPGIVPGDILYKEVTDSTGHSSLQLTLIATGETLLIQRQYIGSPQSVVENLKFADGTIVDLTGPLTMTYDGTPGDDVLNGYIYDDVITGFDGNDTIYSSNGNDIIDAGAGDDSVDGGKGSDTLIGGAGDDYLSGDGDPTTSSGYGGDILDGGAGDDFMMGRYGNDTYRWGLGMGNDIVHEGFYASGTDTIELGPGIVPGDILYKEVTDSTGHSSLQLTLIATGETLLIQRQYIGSPQSVVENLKFADGTIVDLTGPLTMTYNGTAGDDVLNGFIYDNIITGLGGNDVINSSNGNDTIDGGAGNDTIDSGSGNDVIDAGAGDDAIEAGNGNDTVMGGAGNDSLRVGAGNDVLNGGAGDDYLQGFAGNDVYQWGTGQGNDRIYEGNTAAGTDVIELTPDLTPADVTFSVVADPDGAVPGIHSLQILIPSGETLILRVQFNPGSEAAKIERLRFADGTEFDLTTNPPRVIGGTGPGLSITGTSGDDVLSGGVGADVIDGLAGNDVISGAGFDDTLLGGTGNDSLDGGAGDDIVDGGDGNDIIDGGPGDDILQGYKGNDTYHWGAGVGNDYINESYNGNGSDTVVFGPGITRHDLTYTKNGHNLDVSLPSGEILSIHRWYLLGQYRMETFSFANGDQLYLNYRQLEGTTGDDSITGSATKKDQIWGNDGNDWLNGNKYNDSLHGENGDDTLYGYEGHDILDGGPGSDVLWGDYHNDTYRWGFGDGNDIFAENRNTSGGYDVIEFKDGISVSDIVLSKPNSTDVLIDLSSGESITLQNHLLADADRHFDEIRFKDGSGYHKNGWLIGDATADTLTAGTVDALLFGNDGSDTLISGTGNDAMNGGAGADTYQFGRGDNADTVINDGASGQGDKVLFEAGVDEDQLWFAQDGNDLVVTIIGTNDTIRVDDWYNGTTNRVDTFEMDDGSVLTAANVQNLVNAMAAFSPPSIGTLDLLPAEAAVLDPIIAANWS